MILSILILAGISSVISAQSCTAPGGADGLCIPLKDCPTLFAIENKESRTQDEIDLLKQASCGFDQSTPKVCCKHSCYTPEDLLGHCIDIHNCTHLANMIKRPLSEEVVTYLQKSRCNGATQYSVCCGPPIIPYDQSHCKKQVFIKPPNPKTSCCGVDVSYNKIFAGGAANIEDYPWLVLIEYQAQDGKIKLSCGGSLISARYVLTAAHCVVGSILSTGTPKNIRLGEFDTSNDDRDCTIDQGYGFYCNDPTVTIPIESTIHHPDYNIATKKNDIALIRMKENAPFTDYIRPICLPEVDVTANPPAYFKMTAAGWGVVNETLKKSALKLHVRLPLVDNQKCKAAYSAFSRRVTISKTQICAGGENDRDSCKGDSGGALMYEVNRFDLIGVVSFGPNPCGIENVPAVYTKVFEYKDWIYSSIVV